MTPTAVSGQSETDQRRCQEFKGFQRAVKKSSAGFFRSHEETVPDGLRYEFARIVEVQLWHCGLAYCYLNIGVAVPLH